MSPETKNHASQEQIEGQQVLFDANQLEDYQKHNEITTGVVSPTEQIGELDSRPIAYAKLAISGLHASIRERVANRYQRKAERLERANSTLPELGAISLADAIEDGVTEHSKSLRSKSRRHRVKAMKLRRSQRHASEFLKEPTPVSWTEPEQTWYAPADEEQPKQTNNGPMYGPLFPTYTYKKGELFGGEDTKRFYDSEQNKYMPLYGPPLPKYTHKKGELFGGKNTKRFYDAVDPNLAPNPHEWNPETQKPVSKPLTRNETYELRQRNLQARHEERLLEERHKQDRLAKLRQEYGIGVNEEWEQLREKISSVPAEHMRYFDQSRLIDMERKVSEAIKDTVHAEKEKRGLENLPPNEFQEITRSTRDNLWRWYFGKDAPPKEIQELAMRLARELRARSLIHS